MSSETSAARSSLWLMPPPAIGARLAALIQDLSARYGTPAFEPHITLLGGIGGGEKDIAARSAHLAAATPPLPLRLTTVDQRAEYFQCLFVHVAGTDALARASALARTLFDRTRDPEYMPHLSLMYGEFDPAAKAAIVAEIGARLDLEFVADRLALYATGDRLQDWRAIGNFTLGRRAGEG